jgi:hypothetical protein
LDSDGAAVGGAEYTDLAGEQAAGFQGVEDLGEVAGFEGAEGDVAAGRAAVGAQVDGDGPVAVGGQGFGHVEHAVLAVGDAVEDQHRAARRVRRRVDDPDGKRRGWDAVGAAADVDAELVRDAQPGEGLGVGVAGRVDGLVGVGPPDDCAGEPRLRASAAGDARHGEEHEREQPAPSPACRPASLSGP